MKQLKLLLIISLACFLITGCFNKKESDGIRFKEEYETLNKEDDYRDVSIPSDNPMVYINDVELSSKIENKEDMVIYFGFKTCPWCRSIIENLIKASQDLKISKIYYLDILEIRDKKEIDEDGNVKVVNPGSEGYQKLLTLLGDSLSDYTISSTVVGKRIYAPNIIYIKDGVISEVISGVSDMQTDSKMELTKEIKDDSYQKIYDFLSNYANFTCSSQGC